MNTLDFAWPPFPLGYCRICGQRLVERVTWSSTNTNADVPEAMKHREMICPTHDTYGANER